MLSLFEHSATTKAKLYRQRGAIISYMVLLLLVFVISSIVPQTFLSQNNISNLLGQVTPLFLAALGQTFVLLGAGFDLSIGAVISMTSAILALNVPIAIKLPLAFGCATIVGLVNGIGIVKFKIHPIIMTLGTMSIVQGIALIILPVPGGTASPFLVGLASGTVFGLHVGWIWIVCGIIGAVYLMHRTQYGIWLYATGISPENARISGIPASRVLISTYVICALMGALAGTFLAGRLASGDPLAGSVLGLDSVLGAALGGTLLSGGIGGPIGTIAGVLIISVMNNGLNLMSIAPYYQFLLKGGLLIAAVGVFKRDKAGL